MSSSGNQPDNKLEGGDAKPGIRDECIPSQSHNPGPTLQPGRFSLEDPDLSSQPGSQDKTKTNGLGPRATASATTLASESASSSLTAACNASHPAAGGLNPENWMQLGDYLAIPARDPKQCVRGGLCVKSNFDT